MDAGFITVCTVQGEIEEQQLRSFLEVHGIPTSVWGESLRKTHGFVLDGLGEVQIMVPSEHADAARDLLEAVERGEMAVDEDSTVGQDT